MLTLIATLVLLGVLIFVHELGHFLTAKAVDIRVPRFSIGFGPKIFGFTRGETEYVVSWIPLGGYVKMAGMDEMEAIEGKDGKRSETVAVPVTDAGIADVEEFHDVERHFESKPLPARFLVISAGVLMNFLFAALTWAFIAGIWGVPEDAEPIIGAVRGELLPAGTESLADLPPGTRVLTVGGVAVDSRDDMIEAVATAPAGPLELDFGPAGTRTVELSAADVDRQQLLQALVPAWPAVIESVLDGQPAQQGGMQAGDSVVAVNGGPIGSYIELYDAIQASPGRPLQVVVERDGAMRELTMTPVAQLDTASGDTVGRIGIVAKIPRTRLGFFGAVGYGFSEVGAWTVRILQSVGRLFTGRESLRNLGGPLQIGDLAGQFARAGIDRYLGFMAIFSVNLAVLNLLPIPVLDGGHLLFLTIEAVRGRALSIRQRMWLSQFGLVVLVAIMVLAVGNDLIRYGTRLVERLVGG